MTLQEFEDEVQPYFKPVHYQKKEFLLSKDEICTNIAFITKGLTRTYTVDEGNHKHILAFGFENYWVTDRESYSMRTTAEKYIQALEPTDVLVIQKVDFDELFDRNKKLRLMIAALKEKNAIVTYHKVASMKNDSAEEKYNKFLVRYAKILQRIPQHMIASYLGIKPETLSRLRKNPSKK